MHLPKVNAHGFRVWWKYDKHHRKNGPAVERIDGVKYWCKNNLLHRIGGPAVELHNNEKAWLNEGEYVDAPT